MSFVLDSIKAMAEMQSWEIDRAFAKEVMKWKIVKEHDNIETTEWYVSGNVKVGIAYKGHPGPKHFTPSANHQHAHCGIERFVHQQGNVEYSLMNLTIAMSELLGGTKVEVDGQEPVWHVNVASLIRATALQKTVACIIAQRMAY